MSEKRRNVVIGLDSAPPVNLRITQTDLDQLNSALGQGKWITLTSDDATVQINSDKIVFVRVESDEPKVGFGLGL